MINRAVAVVAICVWSSGCGSSDRPAADAGRGAGGAAATGGSTGAGGASGAAGGAAGTGASAGHGGAAGAGGSAGNGGTTGTGGSAGHGGASGGSGAAGHGGSGGLASGGSAGQGGAGGAGFCQAVLALGRSCSTADDCFVAKHQTNCCGQRHFIGMNKAAQAQYQELEAKCEAGYPPCRCAEAAPTTDDGSTLRFDGTAAVTCLQGVCTTFLSDCGAPCGAGTTCFTCSNGIRSFAACTTTCKGAADCHDPALPTCQLGTSGNVSGMYCTADNVRCDTK